jgi:hypothetical protein
MDISELSFTQWLGFTFDHPVETEPWHFSDDAEYSCSDPAALLAYLTEFFRNPLPLVSRYTSAQIEQGMWFIPGPNGYLWTWLESSVPIRDRTTCIGAVDCLFRDLFEKVPLESSGYMWWDSVITYCCRNGKSVVDDRDVMQAIVSCIAANAASEGAVTKGAGIHGAQHLVKLYLATRDMRLKEMLQSHRLLLDLGISID